MEDLTIDTNSMLDNYSNIERRMALEDDFFMNPEYDIPLKIEESGIGMLHEEQNISDNDNISISDSFNHTERSYTKYTGESMMEQLSSGVQSPRIKKSIRKQQKDKLHKKRLRGDDLIKSLKQNPLFAGHDELFDRNLDDSTRKKLMQKIRNRISAQESRDRKKELMSILRNNTDKLVNENKSLKMRVKELELENNNLQKALQEYLKKESSTQGSNDTASQSPTMSDYVSITVVNVKGDNIHTDMSDIGELIRENAKGDANWKTFAIFLVGIMICSMTIPDKNASLQIKTGGIVPMFGRQLLPQKDKVKSLALAEDICSEFCEKFTTSSSRRRGLDISKAMHHIAEKVYSKKQTTDSSHQPYEIILPESLISKDHSVALSIDDKPHSTIYCEAGELFNPNKKYLHIMVPKRASENELLLEEPQEYMGVYAEVLDSRSIKVGGIDRTEG